MTKSPNFIWNYSVTSKKGWSFPHIFVAFSEYINFTKDQTVVNKLILYNNILDLKLLYWLISHFSVSGKESGIVRHWWVVRDIAVDPQWNLWQPVDLDRFGFSVSNFLSILSDFLSWEEATHKNPSNFAKLQFLNNNIDQKMPNVFFCLTKFYYC